MDAYLLKLVIDKKYNEFLNLDRKIVESQLYWFIYNFFKKYKEFPPIEECFKHTEIRDYSAPIEYYQEEYKKKVYLDIIYSIDFQRLNDLITNGKAEEGIQIIKSLVEKLEQKKQERALSFKDLQQIFLDYINEPLTYGLQGITTGWETLDRATQGCQKGDLCLITGRVKTGKTMSLLHMIKSAHLAGHSFLCVSMEMTLLQIARRLFALYTNTQYEPIKTRYLSNLAKEHILTKFKDLDSLPPAYFLEGNFNLKIWELSGYINSYKPDIVYIDGAYLLKAQSRYYKSTWESAKEIADNLKQIALSCEIPIVCSFQLTREVSKRKSESVGLEHIHLTDALSANCSWAIGLFDVENEPNQKLVRILGARESDIDSFLINYDWDRMNFNEIKEEHDELFRFE